MSNESSNELVVKPAPHISGPMSKNRMMQYTFVALLIITAITAALWWQVTTPTPEQAQFYEMYGITGFMVLPLGAILLVNALIAVGVAVGADALIHKFASDSERNTWSAAVFGLIVSSSYSIGIPAMAGETQISTIGGLSAPGAFVYVALISLIGLVVFKKVQGMAGRKLVNPAAAAKFIVLLPSITSLLIVKDHIAVTSMGMSFDIPRLASAIGLTSSDPMNPSFGSYLQGCYGDPTMGAAVADTNFIMLLQKFHGWPGGACSIAVIIVGIALFVIGRKYFKWRITASYLIGAAALSLIMSTVYGDVDLLARMLFTLFIGSSIFLAFFMATDPATTPYTGTGQIIFGVGLAVLTVLMQTYMNFFGGSLLALLIMNLTVPFLDKVGIHKPFGR
jgi:Na+-translocating ferredoxin:NAD+ oxidoreductase RnfD subunit